MDTLKEEGATTIEEIASAEIESANKGPEKTGEQLPPSKERDTTQSAQSTALGNATTRAGRSSGPITNRGKERSRRNAVKHGIFAKVVLLDNEPTAQFDSLLQGFRNDLQPEGTVEEILVEKLASLTWRYRRMLNAERAEIQVERRYNSRAADREKQNREEAAILDNSGETPVLGLFASCDNPLIGERCVELLKSLDLLIKARGFAPALDHQIMAKVFGGRSLCACRIVYNMCNDPGPLSKDEEFKEFDLPPEGRRAKFLEYLRTVIGDFQHYGKAMKNFSAHRERIESRCADVPEALRVDRILRYSTSLERDFDRTLNQLERLQRIRKGQPVPPTLNVNVSTLFAYRNWHHPAPSEGEKVGSNRKCRGGVLICRHLRGPQKPKITKRTQLSIVESYS